jgi:hypothetical protein
MSLTEKRYDAAREATALMTPSDIDDTLNMLGCAPAVRDEIVERLVLLDGLKDAIAELLQHRVGDLPREGWLKDTDMSRRALARLDELLMEA